MSYRATRGREAQETQEKGHADDYQEDHEEGRKTGQHQGEGRKSQDDQACRRQGPQEAQPARRGCQGSGRIRRADELQVLVDAMQVKGYWKSPGGKTPESTLYSSILREIKKGHDSRFKKTDCGTFTLASKK